MIDYARHVLALTDTQLEKFIRDWVELLGRSYFEVKRLAGPGDLGRDVVAFETDKRHQGPWHNYQCKQYGRSLTAPDGQRELGKVLYHASEGHFLPPTRYVFVAPRGVTRPLELLINNPDTFKKSFLAGWDATCAEHIVEGKKLTLSDGLRQVIEAFDFSMVKLTQLDDLLKDAHITPVLTRWFDFDPGPPPDGTAPSDVQAAEMPYVTQLVDAYGEREGKPFADHHAVAGHPHHGSHLSRQRERFYDADAFKRFYRDNTETADVEKFEREILHGVADICGMDHRDSLARAEAVLVQAAQVQPAAGLLAKHARVSVKQGLCHHFANEQKLKWRR